MNPDTTPRCDWSDLDVTQCAHCTGANVFTPPMRWPVPLLADPTVVRPAPMPRAQRRPLPVPDCSDIHGMVTELVEAHGHREPYVAERNGTTWTQDHVTDVPALIHQLVGATPAGSRDESGGGGAKSKPAARIEALDTLILIDGEASAWVRRLGHDDPGNALEEAHRNGTALPETGSGTIACIRLLHGLHAGAEDCGRRHPERDADTGRPACCDAHLIEHDVRRWWLQARIVAGWDVPAYRPFNTCPVCDHRGGLRVNLVMQTALCVECRTVWQQDEIGLLAQHIRHENAEDENAEDEDGGEAGEVVSGGYDEAGAA